MSNGYSNPFKTGGPQNEELVIWWGKCECHIWPLVAGWQARVCGECREYVQRCDPPRSGVAERTRIDHGYEDE